MSSPQIPTAHQVEAERRLRWHQATAQEVPATSEGDEAPATIPADHRLLTLESLQSFVQRAGLLLFVPRPQLAAAPAPTIVEATLGRTESAPRLADTTEARTLVARLIAEGSAVALNLLGAPGTTAENPDFIVSAAAFSYIFTLRGDKLWKQPPANAGSVQVSPLAANAFTILVENGPRTAGDLAEDLGKGLTEAAVLRALGELWQHLRILPVPQPDGAPAMWETATTRFTKQIKAGANAGQPTAMSALISLYLRQVLLATEDEIETFLSPLSARSRVRDVLHGLAAARELETVVIDGRHCLYVADELPDFAQGAAPAAAERATAPPVPFAEDGSRIRRFASGAGAGAPPARGRSFKPGRPTDERERRPFTGKRPAPTRGSSGGFRRGPADRPSRGGERTATTGRTERRPWQERTARPVEGDRGAPHALAGEAEGQSRTAPAGAGARRPGPGSSGSTRERRGGDRPSFADRARKAPGTGGSRPAYSRGGGAATAGGFGSTAGADRRPRNGALFDGSKRRADAQGSRPQAPFRGEGRSASPRADSDDARGGNQAFRRSAGDRDRGGSSGPPRRPSTGAGPDRPARAGAGQGGRPPFRRFDAPRGPKRPFSADATSPGGERGRRFEGTPGTPRPSRPNGQRYRRTESAGEGRPPHARRDGGAPNDDRGSAAKRFGGGPVRASGPGGMRSDRRPLERAGSAPRQGGKPSWSDRAGTGARRTTPAKGGSLPTGRGAAAGAGPFEKFKGGNKPWGKRPPARKIPPTGENA